MSLDVWLKIQPVAAEEVFSANITHNLAEMAKEAGVYWPVWHAKAGTRAWELIQPLEGAIARIGRDQERFAKYNATNGWGKVEDLVFFLTNYLEACKKWPHAEVGVSR
jgi:hypothetical protein